MGNFKWKNLIYYFINVCVLFSIVYLLLPINGDNYYKVEFKLLSLFVLVYVICKKNIEKAKLNINHFEYTQKGKERFSGFDYYLLYDKYMSERNKQAEDIGCFYEAFKNYKKSIWRSYWFMKKAENTLNIADSRFLNKLFEEKEYNEMIKKKTEFNKKQEREAKEHHIIRKYFIKNELFIDDIRNTSDNEYLVDANLSKYKVTVKGDSVRYCKKI